MEKKQSWELKKIESITWQILDIIWQIQEMKSTIDALEKHATSAYDKAEDSQSDIHGLFDQGNSLRQKAVEKKELLQELEEAEKI